MHRLQTTFHLIAKYIHHHKRTNDLPSMLGRFSNSLPISHGTSHGPTTRTPATSLRDLVTSMTTSVAIFEVAP